MDEQHWLNSETSVLATLRQSVQLLRAGFERPWLTLLLTGLLTCALAAFLALRHHDYAPRFVLRVVEADRQTSTAPALKRQLAEYVRQAVFTSAPLTQIMQKHGLYSKMRRNNAQAAIEAFREDIAIDVYQNYFVDERMAGSAPRSARLTVSFHSKDPNVALAVTRDLGALIVQRERERRSAEALATAARAERARDVLVQAVQKRSAEIFSRQRQLETSATPDPRAQVELVGLLGSLEALERQAETAERRSAALGLGAALERRGIGLYFDVVEDGTLPGRAGQLQAALLALGAATLLALPLIAMAVGVVSLKAGPA